MGSGNKGLSITVVKDAAALVSPDAGPATTDATEPTTNAVTPTATNRFALIVPPSDLDRASLPRRR
jgi:hypothetical protein